MATKKESWIGVQDWLFVWRATLVIWFSVGVLCMLGIYSYIGSSVWDPLIAFNVSAFVVMGFDKVQAIRGSWRVPERALYLIAVCMCSAGILAGIALFRHKISKPSFLFSFLAIIMIQAALLTWYMTS